MAVQLAWNSATSFRVCDSRPGESTDFFCYRSISTVFYHPAFFLEASLTSALSVYILSQGWSVPVVVFVFFSRRRKPKPCFFREGADFKTACIGSQLSVSLWLSKQSYTKRWLAVFFTCEESYTQRLLRDVSLTSHVKYKYRILFATLSHKIISIYVIKYITSLTGYHRST